MKSLQTTNYGLWWSELVSSTSISLIPKLFEAGFIKRHDKRIVETNVKIGFVSRHENKRQFWSHKWLQAPEVNADSDVNTPTVTGSKFGADRWSS